MRRIEKATRKITIILKNFFFIWNCKTMQVNTEAKREMSPDNVPKEGVKPGNQALGFEEYREIYMTRCRWS